MGNIFPNSTPLFICPVAMTTLGFVLAHSLKAQPIAVGRSMRLLVILYLVRKHGGEQRLVFFFFSV